MLLALLAPKALFEALFELFDDASCPPFDEEELVAKLFEAASFVARLAFAAELSDALAFRDLPDELEALFDSPLLEPVWKLSPAVREALAAIEPFAAELELVAPLAEPFAAALAPEPLFLVEP